MSTDRELLELAAKAAGMRIDFDDALPFGDDIRYFDYETGDFWNPLAKDGDALRLAVKLAIEPRRFSDWVSTGTERTGANSAALIQEPLYPDPYAATRRAIVRAAAEIGRTQ